MVWNRYIVRREKLKTQARCDSQETEGVREGQAGGTVTWARDGERRGRGMQTGREKQTPNRMRGATRRAEEEKKKETYRKMMRKKNRRGKAENRLGEGE